MPSIQSIHTAESKEDRKRERDNYGRYIYSLFNDFSFKKFIVNGWLKQKEREALNVIKNRNSTESELRFAQGQLDVLGSLEQLGKTQDLKFQKARKENRIL